MRLDALSVRREADKRIGERRNEALMDISGGADETTGLCGPCCCNGLTLKTCIKGF
jgi:hypothetical protein